MPPHVALRGRKPPQFKGRRKSYGSPRHRSSRRLSLVSYPPVAGVRLHTTQNERNFRSTFVWQIPTMDEPRADDFDAGENSAQKRHARRLGGVVVGALGFFDREHWEFSFDSRPTNLSWSWRQVSARGGAIARSGPFSDLRLAVEDAVVRGFSPSSGNWVFRGIPVTARSAARLQAITVSAEGTAEVPALILRLISASKHPQRFPDRAPRYPRRPAGPREDPGPTVSCATRAKGATRSMTDQVRTKDIAVKLWTGASA